MNIEQLKNDLIQTLSTIDKEKLSLADLKLYAEILSVVSNVQTKNYLEMLTETLSNGGFGSIRDDNSVFGGVVL